MDIVEDWLSLPNERHLDEKDSYGYTPLHYAAKFNRCSILKKLVEAGAGICPIYFEGEAWNNWYLCLA